MSGHTPGPWVVDENDLSVRTADGRMRIADVRGWGVLQYKHRGAEEQDANARLIAASPALLAAAKSALQREEAKPEGERDEFLVRSWRSAIAQAEGNTWTEVLPR